MRLLHVNALSVIVLSFVLPLTARAQSLTGGSIRGVVLAADGSPVSGAEVVLETLDRRAARTLESDRHGAFTVSLLPPGTYSILVEQVGFQPVRRLGVTIRAGQQTGVTIRLERRPPPITSVTEIDVPATSSGLAGGRLVDGHELREFDYGPGLGGVSRGTTALPFAADGRFGLGLAGLGLTPNRTKLLVDGFPEVLIRHPGFPGEPLDAPLFARPGLDQVQLLTTGADAEWRSAAGPIVAAQTRRGTNALSLLPWGRFSTAKLGTNAVLNPADSAASSFEVGAVLSGAIVPDTAFFSLSGEYRSIETPSASPWESDASQFDGGPVSLRQTIAAIGADSFGTQLGSYLAPVVRTWKGGGASGRLDWALNAHHALMVRAGYSQRTETNPMLGAEVASDQGTRLEARDISGALSLTSTGEALANELRFGFSSARRAWSAAAVPTTYLVGDGIRFGANPGLPGTFSRNGVTISDAFQFGLGPHAFKAGLNLDFGSHEQDWFYGIGRTYLFGSLDGFAAGQGVFTEAVATNPKAKFSTTDAGLFLEDVWSVTTSLQVLLGLRWETQGLPASKLALNQPWLDASGLRTDLSPKDHKGIAPRVGFVWNVEDRGDWIVRGNAGLFNTGMDPATFSEAMITAGGLTVRRTDGAVDWPAGQGGVGRQRLTFFTDNYRAPRNFKGELEIQRNLGAGVTFDVVGGYYHADYLLRRTDLNLVPSPLSQTTEGRPVFGKLVKRDGMITPEAGTNRRFDDFDLASAMVPTGYADHYEVTASLERRLTRGLTVIGSYTYSRTRDNLVGQLEPDPANQLSPFPGGLNGVDWTVGVSDVDVPHRAAATLEYQSRGSSPITLRARGRMRSGLPFTPTFRRGVDVNGDGGGGTDPAYLDAALPSLATALAAAGCTQTASNTFAERNSCRSKAVQSLDLNLKIVLPVKLGTGPRLAFQVDAFNVVSSAVGQIDRALVLIDPARPLTTTGTGRVVLPLLINPSFGTLQSRLGEPRLVRFGLSLEY
ncbi:MAG: TonB-dependent receptor [Gemmatimonadota bacterium]